MTGGSGSPDRFKMGGGCQKHQAFLKGWNSQPHSWPLKRGEELEIRLITNDQWFFTNGQSCLPNGTLIKTLKDGVQRTSRWVNTCWCWEGGGPGEGMEILSTPSPNILPYTSLPFGHSWVISFMKQNVFMSSKSHSGKLPNLRRELWKSLVYSWSAVSTGGLGL